MTIPFFSSVTDPAYSNPSNTAIDCTVTVNPESDSPWAGTTHRFTASAGDPMDYGQALWIALNAGDYGAIGAYVAPTLTPQQQAIAALAAGIAVTSTGTPSLNGTYPLDTATQAKVNGVVTCIVVNGTFPNAATTMNWYDTSGAPHLFPNVAAFKNFATAFINFVSSVDEYRDSNGEAGSIPSNAITIA